MKSNIWDAADHVARRRSEVEDLLAQLHVLQAHHDERTAALRYAFGRSAPSAAPSSLPPGLNRLSEVNRREFLRLASAAGTFLAVSPNVVEFDWERIGHVDARRPALDDAVLDQYAAMNDHLWRSFSVAMSKSAVFAMVSRQVNLLTSGFERSHRSDVHRRLCVLAADLFQLAGEVLFDASHYAEAAQCYTLAAAAAKEAQAFDLWACAITRHAFIAVYERRHRAAVPMLDLAGQVAARGDPHLSTRHWVDAVRAQAFAGIGDLDLCERALGGAEKVAGLTGRVQNGGWLRFDDSRLAEERGACLVALGQPDLAEPILIQALGSALSVRRRAIVLTDLASAGAQRRDVEYIVKYGQAAVDVAGFSNSGVIVQRLVGLRARLGPFASSPVVRELTARIDSLNAVR